MKEITEIKHPKYGKGSLHPNGGGFVADTATVAPTAYVGPEAAVVGNASSQLLRFR